MKPSFPLPTGACARARAGTCRIINDYERGRVKRPECSGKSVTDLLKDELVVITDRLLSGGTAEDGKDPGRAEGVAFAIAVLENPYRPDIMAVKAENMVRWESEHGE